MKKSLKILVSTIAIGTTLITTTPVFAATKSGTNVSTQQISTIIKTNITKTITVNSGNTVNSENTTNSSNTVNSGNSIDTSKTVNNIKTSVNININKNSNNTINSKNVLPYGIY